MSNSFRSNCSAHNQPISAVKGDLGLPHDQQFRSDADYVRAIREHNARELSQTRGVPLPVTLIHEHSSPDNSPLHHAIWLMVEYLRGAVEVPRDALHELVATVEDAIRGVPGCECLASALERVALMASGAKDSPTASTETERAVAAESAEAAPSARSSSAALAYPLKFAVEIFPDGEREVTLIRTGTPGKATAARAEFSSKDSLSQLRALFESLLAEQLPPLVAECLGAAARAVDWATVLVLTDPTSSMRKSFAGALKTIHSSLEDVGQFPLPPAEFDAGVLRAKVVRAVEHAALTWEHAAEIERVAIVSECGEIIEKLAGRAPSPVLLRQALAVSHEKWRWQLEPKGTPRTGMPKARVFRDLLEQLGIPAATDDALRSTIRRYGKRNSPGMSSPVEGSKPSR